MLLSVFYFQLEYQMEVIQQQFHWQLVVYLLNLHMFQINQYISLIIIR
jgi:hypothetical protein